MQNRFAVFEPVFKLPVRTGSNDFAFNELRIAGTVRDGSVRFVNCHMGFAVRRFGNGFPDLHGLLTSRFAVFDSVSMQPVRTGSNHFVFCELRIAGAVRAGSVFFMN